MAATGITTGPTAKCTHFASYLGFDDQLRLPHRLPLILVERWMGKSPSHRTTSSARTPRPLLLCMGEEHSLQKRMGRRDGMTRNLLCGVSTVACLFRKFVYMPEVGLKFDQTITGILFYHRAGKSPLSPLFLKLGCFLKL
ncbi:unnamed protein product [Victoria cruziana]